MESLDKIFTQDEHLRLLSELMVLESEQEFNGVDNSVRIAEIRAILGDMLETEVAENPDECLIFDGVDAGPREGESSEEFAARMKKEYEEAYLATFGHLPVRNRRKK